MKNLSLMIIGLLFSFSVNAQQKIDTVSKKTVELPAGFTSQIDVIYKQVGNWQGRVDLYLPPKAESPSPVIINIHGGAWRHGTKEQQSGFGAFFKLGFAVANVEYRLSSQGLAPAAIEDVRCVLMYLVNNAKELNIDVNRIVFRGGSAGGHLALLAGLQETDHRFDKDCAIANNFRIAAIIAQAPISSLTEAVPDGSIKVLNDSAVDEWFGSDNKTNVEFAQLLSPTSYIHSKCPPVFLVHGDADQRVPYQQTVTLNEQLKKAGVKTVFITVPGGGHGNYPKENQDEIKAAMSTFLKEWVLKN